MPHKQGTPSHTHSRYFHPEAEMGYTHQATELRYISTLTKYVRQKGTLVEEHKQGIRTK